MWSVQIHKTQLLFPSYIFFQRSITHRPWQPPLPLDESTIVLSSSAKLGCPLARCPGSGHSPNIFQQRGRSWKGGRREVGKVESIARCGGNCLRRKESRFSVMETVGLSLPNPPACHHTVSPLLATFWKTRRSSGAAGRVFHVSCVSRAAPGKPRISASVPPGPPGCKERTVHG